MTTTARPVRATLQARLLTAIDRRFRLDIITRGDGEAYLMRWRLLDTRWGRVYLHRFLAADDVCLHDHPWAFVSIVLWGGYMEETPRHTSGPATLLSVLTAPAGRWRGLWSVARRPARWVHRVAELHPTRPTWTLMCVSPPRRPWGFWTPSGWVHHRRYNSARDCG